MSELIDQDDGLSISFSESLADRLLILTKYDALADAKLLKKTIIAISDAYENGSSATAWADLLIKDFYTIDQAINQFPKLFASDMSSPLVCQFNQVGFSINYHHEKKIYDFVKEKQKNSFHSFNLDQSTLDDLSHLDPWQALSVLAMISFSFCTITGGAGTGKTTTLSKGVKLSLDYFDYPKIILAAPTGKAVNRLRESLEKQIGSLDGVDLKTIHQLLGISQLRAEPYYQKNNRIDCDLLIIDECSMLNSEIFCAVLDALLPKTRVILLGDEQQLPSVKSPSFFKDLCDLSEAFSDDVMTSVQRQANFIATVLNKENQDKAHFVNLLVRLKKNFRFDSGSLIAKYAEAVSQKNAPQLIELLNQNNQLIAPSHHYLEQISDTLFFDENGHPKDPIDCLDRTMILCAQNKGQYSVSEINDYLDQQLRQHHATNDEWYLGRRIIFLKNDYSRNIYNGDIGVCRLINDRWIVDFGTTKIEAKYLPKSYDLAYAISIHKSQGSEYENVIIVLGEERLALINQMLLYTAITRAKSSVMIYAAAELLIEAIEYCPKTNHFLPYLFNNG